MCAQKWESSGKDIAIIGHGPIEEWQEEANGVNQEVLIKQLQLDPETPILVYAGVYGDHYENAFRQFLALFPEKGVQVVIAPHPRHKGVVEMEVCKQKLIERVSNTKELLLVLEAIRLKRFSMSGMTVLFEFVHGVFHSSP